MDYSEFTKYGVVGISLALIGLITFMTREFIKVITNHLQHSNDAITGLQTAITELITFLKMLNGKRR